jgi:MYXO-CTERM domain-containing protein
MLSRLLHVLLLLAVPLCARADPISIVLLGDSITAGATSAPTGPSYATLLADSLGPGFTVTNLGCGGASSLDWTPSRGGVFCGGDVERPNLYQALAQPQLPAAIVTILLGTNDAIGFEESARTDPWVYTVAIAQLSGNLLADGAAKVMLMTPPPNFAGRGAARSLLARYRNAIIALCGSPGDAVVCGPDVYALLDPEDFAAGDIHPNESGQAKIADALHDAVLAAIPEPASAPLTLAALAALAALGAGRRRQRKEADASRPTRSEPQASEGR